MVAAFAVPLGILLMPTDALGIEQGDGFQCGGRAATRLLHPSPESASGDRVFPDVGRRCNDDARITGVVALAVFVGGLVGAVACFRRVAVPACRPGRGPAASA